MGWRVSGARFGRSRRRNTRALDAWRGARVNERGGRNKRKGGGAEPLSPADTRERRLVGEGVMDPVMDTARVVLTQDGEFQVHVPRHTAGRAGLTWCEYVDLGYADENGVRCLELKGGGNQLSVPRAGDLVVRRRDRALGQRVFGGVQYDRLGKPVTQILEADIVECGNGRLILAI